MKKGKCRYRRESFIETYVPECMEDDEGLAMDDVHSQDVAKGEFCRLCGKKVKLMTGGSDD